MARIIELILAFDRKGKGTEEDPVRQVVELWTKSGDIVASFDPHTNESWLHSHIVEKVMD